MFEKIEKMILKYSDEAKKIDIFLIECKKRMFLLCYEENMPLAINDQQLNEIENLELSMVNSLQLMIDSAEGYADSCKVILDTSTKIKNYLKPRFDSLADVEKMQVGVPIVINVSF